jgi:hypothetical protein
MGTSDVIRVRYGRLPIFVLLRPLPGLGCAAIRRPAIEPVGVPVLALLAQILLAYAAAIKVKAIEATTGTKGMMFVLDWCR